MSGRVAGPATPWHARGMSRLRALVLALAILPLGGWKPLWRLDPDVADGNRAYQEGRFDDALAAYQRAEDSGVDASGLAYDRGTALLGKAEAAGTDGAELFAQAFEELGKATHGKDKPVKARAHYNRGNIAMRAKQLDDAIEEYKNALRADPLMEAARSNLELALRQREKQRQQQQQQQGGQGQGQGQQQPQGQGHGQGQPQPQGGQGNQGQNQPQPNPQGQQGNQGNQGQPQPQPGPQGQNGQGGNGPAQRRMPQPQWPHDDTENDTPQTAPEAKLDQLEDMSRQQRRDQVKRQTASGDQPDQDW